MQTIHCVSVWRAPFSQKLGVGENCFFVQLLILALLFVVSFCCFDLRKCPFKEITLAHSMQEVMYTLFRQFFFYYLFIFLKDPLWLRALQPKGILLC